MNQSRCTYPKCECPIAWGLEPSRVYPTVCPMEENNALHHREVDGSHSGYHGTAVLKRVGGAVHVPRSPGNDNQCGDAWEAGDIYVREALEEATDDGILHRRIMAILTGLAVGSVIVLLYAVLT